MRLHQQQPHVCGECIHSVPGVGGKFVCGNPRSIFEGTPVDCHQSACERLEVYSCFSLLRNIQPPPLRKKKRRVKVTCMADMELF